MRSKCKEFHDSSFFFKSLNITRKKVKKVTVTIVDETDDKDKEIDLSIHNRTAKTVPVTQDENLRKRAILQATLEGNYYTYFTYSIMKNNAIFQLLHNKFSQNENLFIKCLFAM